ncbi:MAG: hypothetical protein Q9207_005659 [Kuettlingeria erythrocarpa]
MPRGRPKGYVPQIHQDTSAPSVLPNPYKNCLCDMLDSITSLDVDKWRRQQRAGGEIMYHFERCAKFQSALREEEPEPCLTKADWDCQCSKPGSKKDRLRIRGRKATALSRDPECEESYHLPNCDSAVRGQRRVWCDDDESVEVANPSHPYNPATIVMDILRAVKCDPALPPLDPTLKKYRQNVMAAHAKRKRAANKEARPTTPPAKRPKWNSSPLAPKTYPNGILDLYSPPRSQQRTALMHLDPH